MTTRDEQLTNAERAALAATDQTTLQGRSGTKALRIIDAREQQAKALASALEEAIRKTDEELKAIQLAQVIIGAHNELCAKHAADRAALVAQLERSREAHGLMIIRCTKAEQALSGEKALDEMLRDAGNGLVLTPRHVFGEDSDCERCGAFGPTEEGEPCAPTHAALVAQLEAANGLLARAQDGSAKRPREANTDSVQLDYDIGKHLERNGWRWDAINRKWTQADTATWTEYRGRQP